MCYLGQVDVLVSFELIVLHTHLVLYQHAVAFHVISEFQSHLCMLFLNLGKREPILLHLHAVLSHLCGSIITLFPAFLTVNANLYRISQRWNTRI